MKSHRFILLFLCGSSLSAQDVTPTPSEPIKPDSSYGWTVHSFNSQLLLGLPDRNFSKFPLLASGIADLNGNLHLRGSRAGEVAYMVEGVSVTNPFFNSNGVPLIPEVLERMDIHTGAYGAQMGGGNGGIISSHMRRGGENLEFNVNAQADDFARPGKSFYGAPSTGHKRVVGTLGGTLSVTHVQGPGTASIYPIIINPAAGTGDTYEVRVDTANGATVWSLRNASTNSLILDNQTNISGDENYHTVEGGILLKVSDVAVMPKIGGSAAMLKQTGTSGPGDVFSYTSPSPQTGPAVQQESARRVGVFPNPFYADASSQISTGRRIVTFTNLPERATIRIFNLAGHLIRTLEKNDTSQYLEWDLANEHNWQAASGIYVCHVEMPDIGESKVLKLAIIQPQLIPGY